MAMGNPAVPKVESGPIATNSPTEDMILEERNRAEALFQNMDKIDVCKQKLILDVADFRNEDYHQKNIFVEDMLLRIGTELNHLEQFEPEKAELIKSYINYQLYDQWAREHKAKYCITTIESTKELVEMSLTLDVKDYKNEDYHTESIFMRDMVERAKKLMPGMDSEMMEEVLEKLQPFFKAKYEEWTKEHTDKYCITTIESTKELVEMSLVLDVKDYKNEDYHNESKFMSEMEDRAKKLMPGMSPEMMEEVLIKLQPFFKAKYDEWTKEHKEKYCITTIESTKELVEMSLVLDVKDYKNEDYHNESKFMSEMEDRAKKLMPGMDPEMVKETLEKLKPFFKTKYEEWTKEHKDKYCITTIESTKELVEMSLVLDVKDYKNEDYHNESKFMKDMEERAKKLMPGMEKEMMKEVLEKLYPFFKAKYDEWTKEHKEKYCSDTIKSTIQLAIGMLAALEADDFKNESFLSLDTFRSAMLGRVEAILGTLGSDEMKADVIKGLESHISSLHSEWRSGFKDEEDKEEALRKKEEEDRKTKEDKDKQEEEERKAEEARKKEEVEARQAEEAAKRKEEEEEAQRQAEAARLKADQDKAQSDTQKQDNEKNEKDETVKEDIPKEAAATMIGKETMAVETPTATTPEVENPETDTEIIENIEENPESEDTDDEAEEAEIDDEAPDAADAIETDAASADSDADVGSIEDRQKQLNELKAALNSDIPLDKKTDRINAILGSMAVIPPAIAAAIAQKDNKALVAAISSVEQKWESATLTNATSVQNSGYTTATKAVTAQAVSQVALNKNALAPESEEVEHTFLMEYELSEWLRIKELQNKPELMDMIQELFDFVLLQKHFFKKDEHFGMDWLKVANRELHDRLAKFFEESQKNPEELFEALALSWGKPKYNHLLGHFMPDQEMGVMNDEGVDEDDEDPTPIIESEPLLNNKESIEVDPKVPEVSFEAPTIDEGEIEEIKTNPMTEASLQKIAHTDMSDDLELDEEEGEGVDEADQALEDGDEMDEFEQEGLDEDIDEDADEDMIEDEEGDLEEGLEEDQEAETDEEGELEEDNEEDEDSENSENAEEVENDEDAEDAENENAEEEIELDIDDETLEELEEELTELDESVKDEILLVIEDCTSLEEFLEKIEAEDNLIEWIELMKRRYGVNEELIYLWLKSKIEPDLKMEMIDEEEIVSDSQSTEVDLEITLTIEQIYNALSKSLDDACCSLIKNFEEGTGRKSYTLSEKALNGFRDNIKTSCEPHQSYFIELSEIDGSYVKIRSIALDINPITAKPRDSFYLPLRRLVG